MLLSSETHRGAVSATVSRHLKKRLSLQSGVTLDGHFKGQEFTNRHEKPMIYVPMKSAGDIESATVARLLDGLSAAKVHQTMHDHMMTLTGLASSAPNHNFDPMQLPCP